jgi:hypothetical protein
MLSKHNEINSRRDFPGPGTYEQASPLTKEAAPGYKLGTSNRPGIKSDAPGPGNYEAGGNVFQGSP